MESSMISIQCFRRFVVALACASFLGIGLQAPAAAAVIGTQEFIARADRAADLAAVESFLSRAEVRDQLVALGVDPGQAAERVAALSDRELAIMADRLEELPAGGSLLGVIGAVFVVLIILELVGVIDIFKRV
jgi:hypothetical protein